MTDFKAIIRIFSEAGIECVIVGGVAATIHGSARLTQDIDFVYSRSDRNIKRLVAALRPHNPYPRDAPAGLPFEWSEATVKRGLNFTLTSAIGDLDLLGEIVGGGDYQALLPHATTVELFGCHCRCLDLPGLIRTKRAAGRPKDFDTLAELEALLEEANRESREG